jgi:hypothetical protein
VTDTPTPTSTPCPGDFDCDEVPDGDDNCPNDYNPDQTNTDGQRRPNGPQIPGSWASNPAQDAAGDLCDPDDDNDALLDSQEYDDHCPYRLVADSDGDRVLDGYEVANGYNPCSLASRPTWEGGGDSDGDGFPDGVERTGYNTCVFGGDMFPYYTFCTDPTDSDGDGCEDWIEIVDVNGSRQANIFDVLLVAKRAFDIIPASDSDNVLDINKNRAVNIVDQLLAAQNSTLLRPHTPCGSDDTSMMPPTPTPTPTATSTPTPTATNTPTATPTPTFTFTPTPTDTFTPTPTPTDTPTPTPTPTPCPGDFDCDKVPDGDDNCPTVYNPDQTNTDGQRRPNGSQIPGDWASNPAQDNAGDACDPDDDNDALPDSQEYDDECPYRLVADSDGDRVLDGYEVANGYNPCSLASKPPWEGGSDSDGDGFGDLLERSGYNTCAFVGDVFPDYSFCTDPTDSDGDGCEDWIEIVDVNGSRQANIFDVLLVAKRAFDIIPASDSDNVLDINKNRAVNVVDQLLAAQNSTLLRPHTPCGPEG